MPKLRRGFGLATLFLAPLAVTPALAQTLSNCGYALDISSRPSRIVTIKSTTTDLLLELGLGDKIIGKAFQDGPPIAAFAEKADRIPVLSDRLPSREAVLSVTPDFIFAGWESNVAADGLGPRDLLASYGIRSYVAPAACRSADRPARTTFETLFDDIREAGRVFGADAAAQQLVEEQRAQLAKITPVSEPLKVLWYSSGSDVPYVGAGSGMPQAIMSALGLENIADDIDDGWSSMSWEAVAAEEPDLFILVDASWSSVQRKLEIIQASPLLGKLEAVQQKRFLVIPFAASEAGVRSVPATAELSQQLRTMLDE